MAEWGPRIWSRFGETGTANVAAEAAGAQGHFRAMHDMLYDNQDHSVRNRLLPLPRPSGSTSNDSPISFSGTFTSARCGTTS